TLAQPLRAHMTELAAPQISSLMEALPGIAAVLRSPVATAMVELVRAGAGLGEFHVDHAEELLRFGIRRNLIDEDEVERLLAEVREAVPASAKRPAEAKAAPRKPSKAAKVPKKAEAAKPAEASAAPAKKAPAAKAARKPTAKKAASTKAT